MSEIITTTKQWNVRIPFDSFVFFLQYIDSSFNKDVDQNRGCDIAHIEYDDTCNKIKMRVVDNLGFSFGERLEKQCKAFEGWEIEEEN